MARVIRSEADLSRLLARPGYRVASQFGGEVVDTAALAQPAERRPSKPEVAGSTPAGRSKYGNEKTDGYASKKEAKRAAELRLLEQQGRIRNLREQVKYVLFPRYLNPDGSVQERAASYMADFVYEDELGHQVVEDCKGFRTREYVLKRKAMLFVHGIKIKET